MAASKYANLGAQLNDLADAAQDRLEDAEVLFVAGRFTSSIAMGIYSSEIHLKIKICNSLQILKLPRPFEIHDLDGLLVLRGSSQVLKTASPSVGQNWELISDQADRINDLRYSPGRNWSQADA